MSEWIDTTIGEQITLQRGIDITKAEQRVGTVPVISSSGVSSYHDTAAMNIIFKERTAIAESDEDKPGVILDYDADGNLVSLEILDASTRVSDTRKIEFQMTA
jgi:uncharacterized protein YuzE